MTPLLVVDCQYDFIDGTLACGGRGGRGNGQGNNKGVVL